MLQINNVSKSFGQKRALDSVSLSVKSGSIYGLLGPNGAGKTTLIRIMTGITMPDSGEALIRLLNNNEQNDNYSSITLENARMIGYLPEERGLYKQMKVGEQIRYFARLRGMSGHETIEETNKWLTRLDIMSWKEKKIEELSKGMAQKVQFITTVIHKPQLLILDEPFSGFDPINADIIRQEILRLNAEGTTIILSTHNMESVETLCKEISLINQGKIVLQGAVNAIKDAHKDNTFEVTIRRDDRQVETSLMRKNDGESNNTFIQRISAQGEIIAFKEKLPSMNDIFIKTVNSQNSNHYKND